jgi:hypothetical protein
MATRKAKIEAEVHKEIMKKEWNRSRCTPLSLERLAGWRAPNLEPYPDPQGGEIVVFEEYFTHGFGVPVHPFL